MLKIRQNQLDRFREELSTGYENAVLAHLEKCFPAKLDSMGEPRARDLIRLGIDRARRYGFTTQRLVCKFIDLLFVLDVNFDVDLAWASATLAQCDLIAEQRMQSLISQAMNYLSAGRTS
jgi:hypothetical protein